tara:strand:- start:267 stop:959 length:693 start_codon:yes stop_codon:yes gene_type:complete
MVISHKYKCIFIKVPKNAGTSIHRFFERHDPESIRSDLGGWPWGHRSADDVKNDPQVAPYWDSYFKFAFLREPFSWLVSLYNSEHGADYSSDAYRHAHILLEEGRLRIPEDFKLNSLDVAGVLLLALKMQYYTVPQTPYLNAALDFIGVYENIEEDFEFIKKRTGIPIDLHLTKENPTVYNRPLKFTDKAIEVVNSILKEDIEFYNLIYNNLDSPEKRGMEAHFPSEWNV